MPDISESSSVPRLRMEGVRKRFGATIALDGVDFSVNPGEVAALVGENGAGKSTLMKVLSGAHKPDDGKMWLDGEAYEPRHPLDARKQGVAMIYQELAVALHVTVMENILLGMEPMKGFIVDWSEMRRRAADAMAQLGRPDISPDARMSSLSIAQRQLVEIARAVAVGCRVLVLDEPTSSLAQGDIKHLFDLIRKLKAKGLGIIYISHFLDEVKEISDRFVALRDGKSVGTGPSASTPTPKIISMMVGREVRELYPRGARSPGEAILEIENLAGKSVPKNASLTLHRGEVLGIAGLVGAGRTEMLRCAFGLNSILGGTVRIGSISSNQSNPSKRWRQRMGMVSEDRKSEGLALELSIADNLTMTRLPAMVNPSKQTVDAENWIGRLAVRCRSPRQKVADLSGGNQQKVAIARLLYHDVDVLLLDEPTRGIDVGSKAQIYQVIDDLARAGKAVLMVSSYLPELLGVCDRVAVMCKGVLGPATPVSQTDEHRIMLQATGTKEVA